MKSNVFIAIETGLTIVVIILLLFASSQGSVPSIPSTSPPKETTNSSYNFTDYIKLTNACNFLKAQEADDLGLLVASNNKGNESNVIYLLHDNYLAVRALDLCSMHSLAEKINKTLESYNVTSDSRYDVLFGKLYPHEIPLKWDTIILYNLADNKRSLTVETEVENESGVMYDWLNYTDLVVLKGLDSLWRGDIQYSLWLYQWMLDTWDGYGFNDKVHINSSDGSYEVYKIALAIYFYRTLEAYGLNPDNTYLQSWLSIISRAQSSSGGFYTHYIIDNTTGTIRFKPGVNLETTSIVIISLYHPPPISIIQNH